MKNHSRKSAVSQSIKDEKNKIASLRSRLAAGARCSGAAPISSPPRVVNASIDTLYLSLDCLIPGELLQKIHAAKEAAQRDDFDATHFKCGFSNVFSFIVGRTGKKFYPYSLTTGDITLLLSTRRSGSQIPNASLRVGSITCQENLTDFLRTFRMWCNFHGVKILDEKVSRVDLCADITAHISTTKIDDFKKHLTRGTKKALYFSGESLTGLQVDEYTTGVQVGKKDIVFRAYDKPLEMYEKRQQHKIEFFEKIWGKDQDITRFEFQLRRNAIKEFMPKKSDYETLLKMIEKMWRYLTEEWFVLASKDIDRKNKNQSRARASEIWRLVQSAFKTEKKPAARNRKRSMVSAKMLVQQAVGCLVSVVAGLGVSVENKGQIMGTAIRSILEEFKEVASDVRFSQKFLCRQTRALVSF